MNGLGKWTLCNLSEPNRMFCPSEDEEFLNNHKKTNVPVFSRNAVRLSLELSSTAYTFEIEPWQEAGWQDFSFQVDNTLISGDKVNPSEDGKFKSAISEAMQYLAKNRAQRTNIISQYRGFKRQTTGEVDTCKAVVMIKKLGDKYILAIGFMGTGKRIYDWISNFKVKPVGGLHQGFLELTREFTENEKYITFPKTAAELSRPSLTLFDIIEDMKKEDSKFKIWASGHSQGGAVMQVYFDSLLNRGVKKEHICGIGFASPTVAEAKRPNFYRDYPMVHIINADDLTPRVGAFLHLGGCFQFVPSEEERKMFYQSVWNEKSFQDALAFISQAQGTPQALLLMASLIKSLSILPAEEIRMMVNETVARFLPEKMFDMIDQKLDNLLKSLLNHAMEAYYDSLDGNPPNDKMLQDMVQAHKDLMKLYGPVEYVKSVKDCLALPHKLAAMNDEKCLIAPYLYIVKRGFEELKKKETPISHRHDLLPKPNRTKSVHTTKYQGLTKKKVQHKTHMPKTAV